MQLRADAVCRAGRGLCVLGRIAIVLLLAALMPLRAVAADDVPLTAEERAWIASHPIVALAWSGGLPPYFTYDSAAIDPQGYAVEVLQLAAERVGLHLSHRRFPTLAAAQDAARRGDVAAVALLSMPADRDIPELLPTRPLIAANMVLAVRRDIPDISPAANFGGYRVAVEGGSGADLLLARRFPKARVVRFGSAEAALRGVASGDADLYIGFRQVAVHYIESLLLANVQVRGTLGPGLAAIGPAVSVTQAPLQGILDKALEAVTQRERAALAARWLPAGVEGDGDRPVASLIPAERDWVDNHGRIRVGYDAAFAPITTQTEMSELRGLGADFMRLAASKVGLVIDGEVGGTFAEMYQRGIDGEVDVLVGAARSSARRAHYDFVGPFMRVPTGIVTSTDGGLLATRLDDLGRRRLALLEQHFLLPQLRTRYPALQFVTLPTQAEVLEAVADGRADAAIGNLRVVNQLINDRYTGRIRVTGTVDGADSELYFAVRHDRPELTRLLRKGLDAVTEDEATEIERRWLLALPAPGVEMLQVLRIVAVATALLLWLGTWAWLLRRGNQRLRAARRIETDARRLAEATTASRGRFLGYLSHELRGTMGSIAAGADMARAETDTPRRDRLLGAIQSSAEGFQALLETTLQYEQQIDRPLELRPQAVDLCAQWPQLLAPFELSAQAKGLSLVPSLQCTEPLPPVVIDVPRLRQVVNNLVGNAIKFTARGTVVVSARVSGPPAPWLELTVEDTGPGLSEDDLAALFQPYAQGTHGQRMRQGAGLGLAISRQIVDAMGGEISAACRPEGGARFTVRVPLVLQPVADPTGQLAAVG